MILGIAHARGLHGVFGKSPNGTLPLWSEVLFFPLLAFTTAVWYLIRWISPEAPYNRVTDNVFVGRRLLSIELHETYDNFVDLTAEFSEPRALREKGSYCTFPILDGSAPEAKALHDAIEKLRPGQTFIHCAQGHGRTGMFAAALLLKSGSAYSIEEAMRMLVEARPGIRLSKCQQRCLRQFAEQYATRLQ